MQTYPAAVEQHMRAFIGTLSEKDKRRYAAIEALKLGHGGITYIAQLLSISPDTIRRGLKEITNLPEEQAPDRIRRKGAGRKPYDQTHTDIDAQFLDVLEEHTAGDPMNPDIRWTKLTHEQIAQHIEEKHGTKVSTKVVRKLLKKHNYRQRKAQKNKTMKTTENRNEQFENIAQLKAQYEAAGQPTISIDTKKKEYLGNFYRAGHLYTTGVIETYDHDFSSFAQGRVIPHGIYDLKHNHGYINLGTSHETSEFACDSLRQWWYNYGQYHYPHAKQLLILCDGGGSNSSRHYIFKEDLQALADEVGLEIRIAHYPPYCSKYNPIEHRLFPHVTRACQGVVFTCLETVKQLMEQTKTKTGLRVVVEVTDKLYETGRKAASDFKEQMRIVFDEHLPQWNYRAVPAYPPNTKVI